MSWNLRIHHLDTVLPSTKHPKSISEVVPKIIPSKSSKHETQISISTSKPPNQDPLTSPSHTPLPTLLTPPSSTPTVSRTNETVSASPTQESTPSSTCPLDTVPAKSSPHNPVSSSPHPNQPSKSNGPPSEITVPVPWVSPPISRLSANPPSIYPIVHCP